METTLPLSSAHSPKKRPLISKEDSRLLRFGYILLIFSFALFVLVDTYALGDQGNFLFGSFFVHYVIGLVYGLSLVFQGSFGLIKSWRKENLHKTLIFLHLQLISAYALNREIPVFESSSLALCVYLLLSSGAWLSIPYFNRLPKWVNKGQFVLVGAGLVLYFYLALFVAPYYFAGGLGILFLGIGLHIFVPLALLRTGFCLIRDYYTDFQVSYRWIIGGACLPICCALLFTLVWNARMNQIEKISNQSVLYQETELPTWVKIAQTLPDDALTHLILRAQLVFTLYSSTSDSWEFMPRRNSWDEIRKHDPFVFVASLSSTCSLTEEEIIQIYRSLADVRHKAEERLWAGDNLLTSYVVSDIYIYPELHLAYTEKYLTVKNDEKNKGWWGNRQEAIYTFQLPEGSVVTSLSLWIGGKEAKAVLTSKQKAQNAYKTIVGVEQRDPSVIHWQEGNTVTVRVFPCTTQEERKFKIGVTSPLSEKEGQLYYKNSTFRGPNASSAKETVRVRFMTKPENVHLPSSFHLDKKGHFISEGTYDSDLEFSLFAPPISPNQFSFEGNTFSISKTKPVLKSTAFKTIYLDINEAWETRELDALQELLETHSLAVYLENEFIPLTKENWESITSEARQLNFSLFPFHRVQDASHALVVTKGKELSPHLSDFKDSPFSKVVGQFFSHNKKIATFNLQGGTSTYVASLREWRGLEFATGTTEDIKNLLKAKKFLFAQESGEKVQIYDAGLTITKTPKSDSALLDNAPDHTARLFAYNDIMRKVGPHFFQEDFVNEELVEEARSFYVVSPVSSLIVLETQQDYDRFDIHNKNNSLLNASKHSAGAVPEPHEWALVLIFAGLVLYALRSYKIRFSL